jgi:hypothetical protein
MASVSHLENGRFTADVGIAGQQAVVTIYTKEKVNQLRETETLAQEMLHIQQEAINAAALAGVSVESVRFVISMDGLWSAVAGVRRGMEAFIELKKLFDQVNGIYIFGAGNTINTILKVLAGFNKDKMHFHNDEKSAINEAWKPSGK